MVDILYNLCEKVVWGSPLAMHTYVNLELSKVVFHPPANEIPGPKSRHLIETVQCYILLAEHKESSCGGDIGVARLLSEAAYLQLEPASRRRAQSPRRVCGAGKQSPPEDTSTVTRQFQTYKIFISSLYVFPL